MPKGNEEKKDAVSKWDSLVRLSHELRVEAVNLRDLTLELRTHIMGPLDTSAKDEKCKVAETPASLYEEIRATLHEAMSLMTDAKDRVRELRS